jgi:hypothetical protein
MNIKTKKEDITMKKMHTLFVAVIALALALTSGSARAGFVIIFDDPDTAEIDFRVEDEGEGDTKDGVTGLLGVAIDNNGLEVIHPSSPEHRYRKRQYYGRR